MMTNDTYSDLLILVTSGEISEVGTRVAYQVSTLSTVVTTSDNAEILIADLATRVRIVGSPSLRSGSVAVNELRLSHLLVF